MITRSNWLRSIWVYSYTNDAAMLNDPEKWLKSRLDWNNNMKNNVELACRSYKDLKAALVAGDTDATRSLARDSIQEMQDLMAGHGLYFATDPIISRSFGKYLIAVAIPPRSRFGHYDINLPHDQQKLLDLVFSPEKAIVYWWWEQPALVIRDISVLGKTLTYWTLDLTEHTPGVPLHMMNPMPSGQFDVKNFLSHYRDFLTWASDRHATFKRSKTLMTSSLKLSLLEYQWRKRFGDFSLLAKQSKLSHDSLKNLEFLISAHLSVGEESEWPLTMKLLADIGYLPPEVASKIPYGKSDLLQQSFIAHLQKGKNDKVMNQFSDGLSRLLFSSKKGEPWKSPKG
jgi:hypothetical protein